MRLKTLAPKADHVRTVLLEAPGVELRSLSSLTVTPVSSLVAERKICS